MSAVLDISVGPEATLMEGGIFPYMFLSREGTLVVQAYVDRPDAATYSGINFPNRMGRTLRSVDNGKTWNRWMPTKEQGEGPTLEGAIVQLQNGTILAFDYYTKSIGRGEFKGKLWKSTDQWQTLTGPEECKLTIPKARDGGIDDSGRKIPTGMLFHRSVLELPSGDLLAGVYGWFDEDNTPSQYSASMNKFRSILIKSNDQGTTWSYVATISAGPVGQEGYAEPVILRLSQGKHAGRLICLMRTGRENPLYQSQSDDDGHTWSQPRSLRWMYSRYGQWRNIVGVDPELVELSNGVLVCGFGHKPDYKDDGNFLAFSLDQGATWTQITRLSMDITGGYISVREVTPGTLFVVYDKRDGSYRSTSRRILGRTVKVTILTEQ